MFETQSSKVLVIIFMLMCILFREEGSLKHQEL